MEVSLPVPHKGAAPTRVINLPLARANAVFLGFSRWPDCPLQRYLEKAETIRLRQALAASDLTRFDDFSLIPTMCEDLTTSVRRGGESFALNHLRFLGP